jgi:hypothetical protein
VLVERLGPPLAGDLDLLARTHRLEGVDGDLRRGRLWDFPTGLWGFPNGLWGFPNGLFGFSSAGG